MRRNIINNNPKFHREHPPDRHPLKAAPSDRHPLTSAHLAASTDTASTDTDVHLAASTDVSRVSTLKPLTRKL